MEAQRRVRFTLMLTDDEWAEAKKRAGLVPAAVWARAILFPTTRISDEALRQIEMAKAAGLTDSDLDKPRPLSELPNGQKISDLVVKVGQPVLPRATSVKRHLIPGPVVDTELSFPAEAK